MTTSSAQDVQDAQMVTDHGIKAVSPAKAPWEVVLDTDILPEQDSHMDSNTIKLLEVIRFLIKAPDDDLEATNRAVAEYQEYYRAEYLDENSKDGFYLRQNGSLLTNDIVEYSWELASYFPTGSLQHTRLADFVASFKRQSPQAFDPKDPKLVFDDKLASVAAHESWTHLNYGPPSKRQSVEDYETKCSLWLSTTGFLASLLDLGVLGAPEIWDVFTDLNDGLERPSPVQDDEPKNVLYWQCKASVAAQYILLAGHVIVEEVKHPTEKSASPRTAETWKEWAAALDKIADTISEDAHWDLKSKAKLAHDKMVELWPELFGVDVPEAKEHVAEEDESKAEGH